MWRPSHPQRPPDTSAYEYNARYNIQATEDSEDARQGVQKSQYPVYRPKRPNYRPTPLRWPFIACVAAILSVLLGLIVYARQSMPNSDSTAVIEERTVVVYRLHKRAEGDEDFSDLENLGTPVFTLESEPENTAKEGAAASATSGSPTQTPLPDNLRGGLERPGEIELEVPMNPCGGSSLCTTDVTTSIIWKTIIQPEQTTTTDVTLGTTSKVVTTEIEQTIVIGGTPTVTEGTTEGVEVIDVTVTKTFVEDVTDVPDPSAGLDGDGGGDESEGEDEGDGDGGGDGDGDALKSGEFRKPFPSPSATGGGKFPPRPKPHHTVAPFPTNGTTEAVTTTEVEATETEEISLTVTEGTEEPSPTTPPDSEFSTPPDDGEPEPTRPHPPPPPPPHSSTTRTTRTETFTTKSTRTTTKTTAHPTVTGGTTTVVTKTTTTTQGFPVTTKSPITAEPTTYFELGPTTIRVTYTPAARGQPDAPDQVPITHFTTSVKPGITVTGTVPGQPVAVVSSFNEVQTKVVQNAPQTVVTQVGGGVTTMVVVVTPSPGANPGQFAGVFMTVVSQVGGTLQTLTVQDVPETIVTNIDGVLTTIIRTPPPRLITTMVGGTLTTFGLATTPTATDLLSFTVVTTLDGTLTTFVSTPSPTTVVATISGKLTTFTSTPSPSTFTSTIKGTTKTIASIETPTATGPPVVAKVFDVNAAEYFLGKFLPAVLAVLLAIPLRVIDLNAKLYQPFYALNQESGALGSNSMTLHYTGFQGFITPFATLFQGHPVPFITTMAVWGSSLMVPLATEALGLKIHGHCHINKIEGCALDLGVSPGPTRALIALIALVITLLLILIFFLRNWETGLHANPWSVSGMASFARSKDVRIKYPKKDVIRKEMNEKRYSFGHFRNAAGRDEYGIVLHDEAGRFLNNADEQDERDAPNLDHNSDSEDDFVYEADGSGRRRSDSGGEHASKRHVVPFIALSYPWRIGFALFLGGLFVLILYYHLTRKSVTDFARFMHSQSFGVRFLFAAIGVTITFAWISFFVSVAIITPYQLMAASPQPPEKSILLSRPTHGIYGIYAAIKEGNIFLLLTAFMSLLSEFLPILLANIPYNLTQTERTHVVCSRITLVIIGMMILTLLGSLFIRWPHMPIDPRSIAGAMYYVSESRMVGEFEGVSRMDARERERRVKEMGGRYYYGEVNARGRWGVDVEGAEVVPTGREVEVPAGENVDTEYRGNQI